MLKLRLQRRGKRNYATYRVVVAEERAPVKGKFIAEVGHYNPHTDAFVVEEDAVTDWLAKGVQPSATVHNLLVEHKLMKADKVTSWRPKKRESEDEGDDGEKSAAEAKTPEVTDDKPADETDTKKEDADK